MSTEGPENDVMTWKLGCRWVPLNPARSRERSEYKRASIPPQHLSECKHAIYPIEDGQGILAH